MALTATEKAVLDLHDAGETVVRITRATGFGRSRVQNIVYRYNIDLGQDARREAALRAHTAQLGVLVRAAGGHR